MPVFNASKYTLSQPKPLPVIFLLDCSGSMYGTKMQILNFEFQKMLREFSDPQQEKDIYVAAITFNDSANIAIPLQRPQDILANWRDFEAYGQTAMAKAIQLATDIMESKDPEVKKLLLPLTKYYRPVVLLISDGEASESEEEVSESIRRFAKEGRITSNCNRWSFAIGRDFNQKPLEEFIADDNDEVISIDEYSPTGISDFFDTITLKITQIGTKTNSSHGQPTNVSDGY